MRSKTLVIILLCVVFMAWSGCVPRAAGAAILDDSTALTTPATVGSYLQALGSAPAGQAVSTGMRPFYTVGLGFIVLGGIAFVLGMKSNGAVLWGVGFSCVLVAVLFVQYPYVALVPPALAAAMVYDRWRQQRQLQATILKLDDTEKAIGVIAEKVEVLPEGMAVKRAIANDGPEVEQSVRHVITPIKNALRLAERVS